MYNLDLNVVNIAKQMAVDKIFKKIIAAFKSYYYWLLLASWRAHSFSKIYSLIKIEKWRIYFNRRASIYKNIFYIFDVSETKKKNFYSRMQLYIRLVELLSDNRLVESLSVAPGKRRQPDCNSSGRGLRASLPRIRRSSIDDTFAESFSTSNSPIWICARMRKSPYFSPGTHPSNQAEMGARSPDLSTIPSFLFLLRYLPPSPSLSFSLSSYPHTCIVLCLGLDPQAGPIISREVYGMVHNSVDKNNQVWLLVMMGLSCPA